MLKLIERRKEWVLYKKRLKRLRTEYRSLMKRIEVYLFNFVKGETAMDVLYDILDIFEDGSDERKKVSDVIGDDVIVFCDEILKTLPDADLYAERKTKVQERVDKQMAKLDEKERAKV